MTEPPKSKPYHLSLTDCAVSAETCPPQPVRGLDLQSFHSNPHRSCFAGTHQPSNSLVSFTESRLHSCATGASIRNCPVSPYGTSRAANGHLPRYPQSEELGVRFLS